MIDSFSHLSTGMMWTIFAIIVCTILFLDLFVFHKKAEEPSFASSLRICISYMCVALLFGLFVIYEKGTDIGMLFYTGYLVEFSLSMDNIFVISLVFTALKIPSLFQHRVLFWGVLGAIFMRAIMILVGAQLVSSFHWVLYVFSAFLIYTGLKMLAEQRAHQSEKQQTITDGKFIRFLKRFMHVTDKLHGEHFFVKTGGKFAVTPLFFALVTIELMDVVFAVDSIPAIFLITQDVFVVYTSNIFAILGLRSLYFLLDAAVNRFIYLKQALSCVLIFIGSKIFLPSIGIHVSTSGSLIITFLILFAGIGFSLYKTHHTERKPRKLSH